VRATARALRKMSAKNTTRAPRISTSTTISEINWVMIRAVLASVADVAIVPLQDVLALQRSSHESSGTVSGNWKWRYRPGALSGELGVRLRSLVTCTIDRKNSRRGFCLCMTVMPFAHDE